jgi:hypothetical protein
MKTRFVLASLVLAACGTTDVSTPPANAPAPVGKPIAEQPTWMKTAGVKGPVACTPDGDGGRAGYHSPDGSTWIKDCNTPHGRAYYRAFADRGTAYLMPRPDGWQVLAGLCKTATGDMRALLDRYDWCAPSVSPSRVNAMTPDDALALAHQLNKDLKFVAADGMVGPYPMADDVAAACSGIARGTDLASACTRMAPREDDLGIVLSPAQTAALADALNRLYGIP